SRLCSSFFFSCFFFNDPTPTQFYTLSLHDALPISALSCSRPVAATISLHVTSAPHSVARLRKAASVTSTIGESTRGSLRRRPARSEEHTSELQSRRDLVCRLLLEKKKKEQKRSLKE